MELHTKQPFVSGFVHSCHIFKVHPRGIVDWNSFLFMAESYSSAHSHMHTRKHAPHFACSSGEGHFGGLHLLATVNSATVNIRAHILVRTCLPFFRIETQVEFLGPRVIPHLTD